MGMFDYVDCEKALPDGWKPIVSLQTKDFANPQLETYTITGGGRLILNGVDQNYHGCMNFYSYYDDVWHEYSAKFTDGQLVGIEIVDRPELSPA